MPKGRSGLGFAPKQSTRKATATQQETQPQPQSLGLFYRRAEIAVEAIRPQSEGEVPIIQVSFASKTPVMRSAWMMPEDIAEEAGVEDDWFFTFEEVLSMTQADWDVTRVEAGVCPFLSNHYGNELGLVRSVTFASDRLSAEIAIDANDDAQSYYQGLLNQTRSRGISLGYSYGSLEVISPAEYEGDGRNRRRTKLPVLRAKEITLFEISAACIPADPNVGVERGLHLLTQEQRSAFQRSAIDLRNIHLIGDLGIQRRAAADELETGDFVSWNTSGGRARGQIDRIERDGEINVPDSSFTITGTEDNPAALITVWRSDGDGGYEATDRQVGHRFSTLTKIEPLSGGERSSQPTETRGNMEELEIARRERDEALQQRQQFEAEAANLRSEMDKMRAEVALQQRNQQISTQFSELRDQAIALRDSEQKLSPAEFDVLFGEDSTAYRSKLDAMQKMDDVGYQVELGGIRTALNLAKVRTPQLPTKLATDGQSLPVRSEKPATYESDMARFRASRKSTAHN